MKRFQRMLRVTAGRLKPSGRSNSLWSDGFFRNLWSASTISNIGTMLGALSLTAVVYLDASAAQMGLLAAAMSSPVLLFALITGVWIDRLPRLPVMVFADLGRFALLLTVPVAALAGRLHIEQLYVVAFLVGCLNVIFNLAYRSALPLLVPHDRLIEANSALGMSESVAASASPAIGGAVVQTLGGPLAVFFDAMTFLASGLFVRRIRARTIGEAALQRSALAESLEGLRAITDQPALRAVLGMVATYSLFSGFILTLYTLWVIEGLGFSPLALGMLLSAGGIGSLVGAGLAGPVARRFGLGLSMTATYVFAAGLLFLTPLAGGPAWVAFLMLLCDQSLGDALWAIHNIQAISLRQAIIPERQLGRVNAIFLLASQGLRPLGALVAGIVAGVIGLQGGLLISAAGISAGSLWLLCSPLTRLREVPTSRNG